MFRLTKPILNSLYSTLRRNASFQKPAYSFLNISTQIRTFTIERPNSNPKNTSQTNAFDYEGEKIHKENLRKDMNYSNRDIYGICFLLLAAGVTAYMFVWQVRRYFWKRNLIEYRSNQIQSEAVPLKDALKASMVNLEEKLKIPLFNRKFVNAFKEETEYRFVRLRGKFLYEDESYVGYASAPIDVSNVKRRETQRGVYILTPFVLDEPITIRTPSKDHQRPVDLVIERVYVNRGWIINSVTASYLAHPVHESIQLPNGKRCSDVGQTTELEGVLWYGNHSPPNADSSITNTARDGKSKIFQHMHLDVMASNLDYEFSIFKCDDEEYDAPTIVVDTFEKAPSRRVKALDVEIANNVDTIAISPLRKSVDDYIQFYTTPYNHIVYALTWGSFCLFASYILGSKYLFREVKIKKWFTPTAVKKIENPKSQKD